MASKTLTTEELFALEGQDQGLTTEELFGKLSENQKEKGFFGKAYDVLSIPEQKSKEGLEMIAESIPSAEPTGNAIKDIALNTPRIAVETLAEVAPSFISPESIIASGALKAAPIA